MPCLLRYPSRVLSELPRLLLCSFDVLPGPTGSSRRLTEYLRGLSEHFSVVVLSAKTPDHSHIQKFHGARLLRVPIGAGDLATRLQTFDRAVRRQLESEDYAVCVFTDPFGGYALCELRESYGYKLIYDAQSFPSQELRYTHPQVEGDRRFLAKVRRQELFCLMNADRVVTGSEVTRTFIRGLGVQREQIELLRAPVDLEPYTEEALGIPDGAPMRVLYLGSQYGWQGLPTLLRGLKRASEKADLRLVILGPSHTAWQPLLQDLVAELELSDRVEFQPPVPHEDLHKVLALADVGALPLDDLDRNRIQGGALSKAAEYLAAGRPVIASDLPVTREHLKEDCTLFHEPGDAEDLGECLITLAQNIDRRVKMGRAAGELARRRHDAEILRARIRQLSLEIAGLAPVQRRSDEEESDGPAPTLIGSNPVIRDGKGTDPAIAASASAAEAPRQNSAEKRRERRRKRREEVEASSTTNATDRVSVPGSGPKIVMGTPLREKTDELPARTEPGLPLSAEPPVVMGTPVREDPPVVVGALEPEPVPEPQAAAPEREPEPELKKSLTPPPEPTPSEVSLQALVAAAPPLPPPPIPPPLPPRIVAQAPEPVMPEEVEPDAIVSADGDDGPMEIASDEVVEADDAVEAIEADDAVQADDAVEAVESEEAIAADDAVEADDSVIEAVDDAPGETPPAPSPAELESVSRIDAWFAQLVHGYCPPEGTQFQRPTPPTNFPGREGPPPATVQPPAPSPQSFPTRQGGG